MRNKLVPFMLIDFRRQQATDNPLFVAGRSRPSKEGGRCSEFIPIIVEDCELLVGVKANLHVICHLIVKLVVNTNFTIWLFGPVGIER